MEQNPQMPLTGSGSFLGPDRVVRYFELQKGDYVADFGAGHGYFTIPMARAVGGDGKVYAIDVQKSTLEIITNRAKVENLLNIEAVWGTIETVGGSKLKNAFLDFVLMASVLFQSDNKAVVFQEAARVLHDKGRLAVIEWDQSVTPLGPPLDMRVKKEVVKSLAAQTGFILDREFEAGNYHYGLLFKKSQ